ncbi:MAG: HAD-IA family hydrolase [Actinomycetia bacterium]|nr:HAD-IA family hydrolase [Actinomycetes bacterium]
MSGATESKFDIRCVLFDLDGVVRQFDRERYDAVERAHGLTPGTIGRSAFEPDRIKALVTGGLTRAQWMLQVGELVGAPAAVRAWAEVGTVVDDEVLAIVDEVRAHGIPAAILTNGTDTVPAELADLGIDTHFDTLFNTAEIGVAKPDPAIYHHVCAQLGLSPARIFFTDDSPGNVIAATEVGLVAEPFTGAGPLRSQLIELGVLSPR